MDATPSHEEAAMMSLMDHSQKYLDQGLDLIALSGKKPIDREWTNSNEVKYTPEGIDHAIKNGHNIGHRLNETELVIDVDPQNGGLASYTALTSKLIPVAWLQSTVNTPNSGFHIYTTLPDEFVNTVKLAGKLSDYPGIDFLSKGRQVVIPGSTGANGKVYSFATQAKLKGQETPMGLIELLVQGNATASPVDHMDDDSREKYYIHHGWNVLNAEQLADYLTTMPAENFREYTNWFTLLASCHFATGGDNQCCDVFSQWSTMDAKYTGAAGQIEKHWDSLSKEGSNIGGKPITALTLVNILKHSSQITAMNSLTSRINSQRNATIKFDAVKGDGGGEGGEGGEGVVSGGKYDDDIKLRRWMDKLSRLTDEAEIVGSFIKDMAEAPDLKPAQRDLLFNKIKDRTGVGLGTLREDFKAHSEGIGSFLESMSGTRDTVTQTMVLMGTVASLGGRKMFMFCNENFYVWRGTGKWELEHPMIVQKAIMSTMESLGFKGMNSGNIGSVSAMLKVTLFRRNDVWERGDTGKSDATINQENFQTQLAPTVNVINGTLKLTKDDNGEGKWTLDPHRPDDYTRHILPVRYPEGKPVPSGDGGGKKQYSCPKWLQLINQSLWCEDQEELQVRIAQLGMFLGYSMVSSMPWLKKSVYFHGVPDSGKSVIMDTVFAILGGGDNVSVLDITQMGSRFGSSSLEGKLANLAGEIGKSELMNDGIFKSLVSGDTVMTEQKGKDGVAFKNRARFWFAGNNFPRTRDKSSAIESRILYLPFNWTVPPEKRNANLRGELMGELDGITEWALDVFAAQWSKDYCMSLANHITQGMSQVMKEWKDESDPIRVWFDEEVNTSVKVKTSQPGDAVKLFWEGKIEFTANKALYTSYKHWCREYGYMPMNGVHFSRGINRILADMYNITADPTFKRVIKRGSQKVTGRISRGYHGLSLENHGVEF